MKNQQLISILTAIFIIANSSIFATTYYVALTGNDSNSGTISSPFRTIAYGASILVAGDTLIVKDGDYGNENVIISQSGTASAPIVITAENIGQAILNGPRLPNEWDSDCGNGIFIVNETTALKYITISGFYIKNYETGIYGEGDDGIYQSNIHIENCTLKNNTGDGAGFWKVNNLTIENCTFISEVPEGVTPPVTDDYVLQDYGIGLYYVDNSLVQNNYFFGTHAQGISFKYGCHTSMVKQNIFEGIVSAAIFFGQWSSENQPYCTDMTAEKNIIRCADGYELETPIRIDVSENVNVLLNYMEGFGSHTEEYGIHLETSVKGNINIHDNIIAFGTIANSAQGIHPDYGMASTPIINIHHNTIYSVSTDLGGELNTSSSFINNISFQCEYYDETGTNNFIGDPSFLSGNPVKQTEVSVPTVHDFDTYYTQLTNPFKLTSGSSAEGYGYRFDYTAGVNSIPENEIVVFPNPVSNFLTINSPEKILKIVIYNTIGQKVLEEDNYNNQINVSKLTNGIYFILLHTDNKDVSKKIIIKKK